MIIHLKHRGVLKVSGSDARDFLQRLLTQDVSQGDHMRYGALLNAKGKYLYDLFIWFKDDSIYLDSERTENLLKLLNMYKLRANVRIEDISHTHKVYALSHSHKGNDFISAPDPRHEHMGHRLITTDVLASTMDLLAYDTLRLPLDVADGSRDMLIDKSLLMDFNFDDHHGISWKKGCYVGQENTNRSRRPELRRRQFKGVEIENTLSINYGDSIMVGDQIAGTICSVCESNDKTYLGALLQMDCLNSQLLTISGKKATILNLK